MTRKRNRSRLIVGSIVIFIVFSFLSKYLYYYLLDKRDRDKVDHFFKKNEIVNDKYIDSKKEEIKNDDNFQSDNYIAILEIPKINLKKGIYDKNDEKNNVDLNVMLLKDSIMPLADNTSHIILASHSGFGYIAFFKDINKLRIDDDIYFYYENIKYVYKVSNFYEINKNGTMKIKFTNDSDIRLVTCVYGTKKQLVYVANLIEKRNY